MQIINEIINIFNKQFSNLTVTRIMDNGTEYIIEAVEDLNKTDYNDPYWSINKKTKEIKKYLPSIDLDSFFVLIEKDPLYSIE